MEKDKLLNLMRFWLFGTFLIVFVATFMYVGLFTDRNWFAALQASAPIWAATAVLCVAWYLVYKWYIQRKDQ